jgi:hypothetical protein
MDTRHGLPFFRPGHAAPPLTPGRVRVKAARYATNKERFPGANANLTTSAGPSTTTEPMVKTVLWRPLKNDKIPYEDRHLRGLM